MRREYPSVQAFKSYLQVRMRDLGERGIFRFVQDIDVFSSLRRLRFCNGFFIGSVRGWEEMREKLDNHEIAKEEYEEWKCTWDNGS